MSEHYKAVRLDRTSHYDQTTKWRKGAIVRVHDPSPASIGSCGRGIHSSASLLDAVSYQSGPSLYCVVEPLDSICADATKTRSSAVRVIRWLGKAEQDEIAEFKLWEANHPVHPLRIQPEDGLDLIALVEEWASVRASVWDSAWASVRASVWDSVEASVRASVWDSVRDLVWDSDEDSAWASVRDSAWASVRDSAWAYIGGLFPHIEKWHYGEKLGPDPWRPLLTLWYAGYVPSFDGKTWRVHAGPNAQVVMEWKP